MTNDELTTTNGQASDRAAAPGDHGRRWFQLGWQPIGDADLASDADDARRPRRLPEAYVTDHRAARILSAVLAVGVGVGTVFWWFEATDRFDVPSLVCAGCAPPDWLRWSQLIVAVLGIVAAAIQVVYFLNFAVRGVVWRRWRGVTIVFGALAGVFTLMWWIQEFWF